MVLLKFKMEYEKDIYFNKEPGYMILPTISKSVLLILGQG